MTPNREKPTPPKSPQVVPSTSSGSAQSAETVKLVPVGIGPDGIPGNNVCALAISARLRCAEQARIGAQEVTMPNKRFIMKAPIGKDFRRQRDLPRHPN